MATSSPSPKTELDSAPPAGWGRAAQQPAKHPPSWRVQLARLLRYSPSSVLVGVGTAVVAVVVAGWLTRRLWDAGPLPGDDTMAHLVRAEFGARWLAPRGRVDGWQPNFGLGYEQYLFLGPGLSWAVAAVHWLSLGLVSVAGAFKVVVIGSFLALPLAVAFLARSFGLGRRAAGLAAVLALCVSNPFGGVGIPGTFDIGLAAHQFGAIPTVLALGGMLRVAVDPRPRWIVFTAAAVAATLVSHAISAIILAVLLVVVLPTLLATDRPAATAVARLAATVALASALAGFWLLPVLAHRDLHGGLTSWENPPLAKRLADILGGQLLFKSSVLIWLLLAGWLFCVARFQARRRWALALLVCPFAYLWVADAFLRWNPNNLVSLQLTNRGLGYVGLVAVLPLAALLGHLGRRLGWLGDLASVAGAVVLVVLATGPDRHLARVDTPSPQLRQLAAVARERVPPGVRFAVQRSYGIEQHNTGVSMPSSWLAWASGRNVANMFNPESSPLADGPAFAADRITEQPPAVAADELARLGVTHVAVVDDQAGRALFASPRFRVLWRSAPLALLEVRPRPNQPAPGSLLATAAPGQAELLRADPEDLVIRVETAAPTTATVATSWSPKWHATVNGQAAPLGRSPDGLLALALPAGPSTIALSFRPDRWDHLGAAVTLLSLAALAALARRRWPHPAGVGDRGLRAGMAWTGATKLPAGRKRRATNGIGRYPFRGPPAD
jgi:6-pyruvoyl-tetrahydropterin synthase related domain